MRHKKIEIDDHGVGTGQGTIILKEFRPEKFRIIQ